MLFLVDSAVSVTGSTTPTSSEMKNLVPSGLTVESEEVLTSTLTSCSSFQDVVIQTDGSVKCQDSDNSSNSDNQAVGNSNNIQENSQSETTTKSSSGSAAIGLILLIVSIGI